MWLRRVAGLGSQEGATYQCLRHLEIQREYGAGGIAPNRVGRQDNEQRAGSRECLGEIRRWARLAGFVVACLVRATSNSNVFRPVLRTQEGRLLNLALVWFRWRDRSRLAFLVVIFVLDLRHPTSLLSHSLTKGLLTRITPSIPCNYKVF